MADNMNPEALHDLWQGKEQRVGEKFVNPGTPETALVTKEQMTKATISGNGAEIMKKNLVK